MVLMSFMNNLLKLVFSKTWSPCSFSLWNSPWTWWPPGALVGTAPLFREIHFIPHKSCSWLVPAVCPLVSSGATVLSQVGAFHLLRAVFLCPFLRWRTVRLIANLCYCELKRYFCPPPFFIFAVLSCCHKHIKQRMSLWNLALSTQ